jgi:hypothetical protein
VKRAESESEVIAVGHLMKDMPRAPTAAIAWLERRFGKRWTRMERQQVEIAGPGGQPIEVTLSAREHVRAKLEELHLRGLIALPSLPADDGERPETWDEAEGAAPMHSIVKQELRDHRKRPSFA